MRGLSEQFEVSAPGRFVFPPHAGVIGRLYWQNVDGSRIPPLAGVIGKSANIVVYRVGIPPVCGGYRSSSRNSDRQCRYSPRVRGLSVNVLLIYECGDVFPPDCGGYRSKSKIRLFEKWYSPPAYGGYRHEPAHSDAHLLYSPRMRGLSVRLLTENWDLFVFPPHAGVIGRPGAQENWLNSIPPAYGGYRFPALRRWWSPRTPPACGGYWPVRILRNRCRAYSPRLRGLSGHEREPLRECGVFPQHAGVST
ncbi:Uncharacterised protein [Klebsiella pneumoniae]|nr:Uncharacterised protein [Klebsiella pneumoniae]